MKSGHFTSGSRVKKRTEDTGPSNLAVHEVNSSFFSTSTTETFTYPHSQPTADNLLCEEGEKQIQ